jgi:hypothetical protein
MAGACWLRTKKPLRAGAAAMRSSCKSGRPAAHEVGVHSRQQAHGSCTAACAAGAASGRRGRWRQHVTSDVVADCPVCTARFMSLPFTAWRNRCTITRSPRHDSKERRCASKAASVSN